MFFIFVQLQMTKYDQANSRWRDRNKITCIFILGIVEGSDEVLLKEAVQEGGCLRLNGTTVSNGEINVFNKENQQ